MKSKKIQSKLSLDEIKNLTGSLFCRMILSIAYSCETVQRPYATFMCYNGGIFSEHIENLRGFIQGFEKSSDVLIKYDLSRSANQEDFVVKLKEIIQATTQNLLKLLQNLPSDRPIDCSAIAELIGEFNRGKLPKTAHGYGAVSTNFYKTALEKFKFHYGMEVDAENSTQSPKHLVQAILESHETNTFLEISQRRDADVAAANELFRQSLINGTRAIALEPVDPPPAQLAAVPEARQDDDDSVEATEPETEVKEDMIAVSLPEQFGSAAALSTLVEVSVPIVVETIPQQTTLNNPVVPSSLPGRTLTLESENKSDNSLKTLFWSIAGATSVFFACCFGPLYGAFLLLIFAIFRHLEQTFLPDTPAKPSSLAV